MPWVRFVEPFNWMPPERGGRVSQVYEAGAVVNVTRACADAALEAGKAKATKNPRSEDERG